MNNVWNEVTERFLGDKLQDMANNDGEPSLEQEAMGQTLGKLCGDKPEESLPV